MILSKVCMLCSLVTACAVVIAQARLIEIHTTDEKMTGLNNFQDGSPIPEPMEKPGLPNFLLNQFVRISKTFWPQVEESYVIKSLRRKSHGNFHKKPKPKNHPEDTNHHNKENHPEDTNHHNKENHLSTESPQHKDTKPKEENNTPKDIEHSNDAKHSKDTKSSEHKNTPKEENPSNTKTDPNSSGHGTSNANHVHGERDYDSHYPLLDKFVYGMNNDDGEDEDDEEPKGDERNDENEPSENTTPADEKSPTTRENSPTTNKISLKKQSLRVVSLGIKNVASDINEWHIDEDSSANTIKDRYFPETRLVDEKSVADKNSFAERVF